MIRTNVRDVSIANSSLNYTIQIICNAIINDRLVAAHVTLGQINKLGIKEGRPEAADGPEAYPLRPENPAASSAYLIPCY